MSSIAFLGAPARASMVTALFDGRARTASELARVSGVSSSTASEHLEKLRAGRLVVCERFGRFRYYKLAGSEVAELLEPLVHLVGKRPVPFRLASRAAAELQNARMCYDHLAGRLGVMLTEAMLGRGQMVAEDRDFDLTPDGETFCGSIGIRLEAVRLQQKSLRDSAWIGANAARTSPARSARRSRISPFRADGPSANARGAAFSLPQEEGRRFPRTSASKLELCKLQRPATPLSMIP